MQVQMKDRLARCCSDVPSDVVSGGRELFVQDSPHSRDRLQHFALFLARSIEPSQGMAARDDESMARRNRETVEDCFDQIAFMQYTTS